MWLIDGRVQEAMRKAADPYQQIKLKRVINNGVQHSTKMINSTVIRAAWCIYCHFEYKMNIQSNDKHQIGLTITHIGWIPSELPLIDGLHLFKKNLTLDDSRFNYHVFYWINTYLPLYTPNPLYDDLCISLVSKFLIIDTFHFKSLNLRK